MGWFGMALGRGRGETYVGPPKRTRREEEGAYGEEVRFGAK